MKFWVKTANVKRALKCIEYGIFEGVISNPGDVSLEKMGPKTLFKDLCGVSPKVYYQIKDGSVHEMTREAEEMVNVDPDKMLIKVPATRNGIAVIKKLSDQGLKVMATAVPTSPWMVFAISAGAVAIAPYSGMLKSRNIISKYEGVFAMQEIIDAQNYNVEICTGIYHATEIPLYASQGIKQGFIWEKDVEAYLSQDLADEAAAAYAEDWKNIKNKISK
mgnify:FL=1|jgi:transaldolase|tara:strand:+ start:2401 stop:3057 length:657 start_codon:yes stop_codon:yes gene_type:complete